MVNLKRQFLTSVGLPALALGGMMGIFAGCGGGASESPTIVIKPSRQEAADVPSPGTDPGTPGEKTGTVAEGESGTFEGTIVFRGGRDALPAVFRDPKYPMGAPIKDAEVCSAKAVPNEEVVVGESGGIANVFIYMNRAPRGVTIPPAPEEPVVFDQEYCVFFPRALVVRTGQTVEVHNSDAIAHNTHTIPARNSEFNQAIQKGNVLPLVYTNPEREPVQVICDFHNWMKAFHLPLDHPFMAVTDENGKFKIEGLPPGTHEFVIWQEKAKYLNRGFKVTVEPGKPLEPVTIEYGTGDFAWKDGPEPKSVKLSSLVR
jgi:plastocyanin